MIHINKEMYKTYFLIFLIFLSLFLTGNLWISNSRGLSFIMESNTFANTGSKAGSYNLQSEMKAALMPYRIVVNDGERDHWVLHNAYFTGDEAYKQVWVTTQMLLNRIYVEKKFDKSEILGYEDWIKLTSNRSMRVDFKTALDVGLMQILLDAGDPITQSVNNYVKSVIIAPWDNINESYTEVYVLGSEDRVFKFTVPVEIGLRSELNEIYRGLKNSSNQKYTTFYDQKISKTSNDQLSPSILVLLPTENIKFKYPQVKLTNEIEGSFDSGSTLSAFGKKFFKNESDAFSGWNMDETNKVIYFKSKDAVLRVYPDGLMEYYNVSIVQGGDKSPVTAAYETAVSFLLSHWGDNPKGIEVYLSGVSIDDKGAYSFQFDYEIQGIPVVVNYNYSENNQLNSAVSIKVYGGKVENCLRYMKKVEFLNKTDDIDIDMYTAIGLLYKKLKNDNIDRNTFLVKDIYVSYDITGVNPQNPVWVFRGPKNQVIPIEAVDSVK